ncbi:MAG TPA: tetratricopeptide repeat protein, partial [Hyphomicrobiales bacterium]
MRRSWLTRLMGSVLLAAVLAWGLLDAPSAPAEESIDDLGSRFQSQLQDRKYDEAAQTMQQIIAVAEQQLGPDHPKVADAIESLGTLYSTQNRDAEAEPYFRRALAIKEKTLGADHPEVATLLISLANAAQNQGRYPEAETLARRAV